MSNWPISHILRFLALGGRGLTLISIRPRPNLVHRAPHALRILALRRYWQVRSSRRLLPRCRDLYSMSTLPPVDELPAPRWARADYPKIPTVAIATSPGRMSGHFGWPGVGPCGRALRVSGSLVNLPSNSDPCACTNGTGAESNADKWWQSDGGGRRTD